MHALKAYRGRAGLTQPELARKLKLSWGYISLLETGKRQASPELARKIEKLTGIPKASIRPDLWA